MDNKEELEDDSMDSVTIGDCVFMLLTILPDGNIHYVDVDSDELAEFLREKGEFKVLAGAIGYIQENKAPDKLVIPVDRRDIN